MYLHGRPVPIPRMATPEILPTPDDACEREESSKGHALEAAAAQVGPLRNPDACVLLCPDCTCRRLLDERRAERDAASST
jgi:hypothetical protein